jgi:hypothetical protein
MRGMLEYCTNIHLELLGRTTKTFPWDASFPFEIQLGLPLEPTSLLELTVWPRYNDPSYQLSVIAAS